MKKLSFGVFVIAFLVLFSFPEPSEAMHEANSFEVMSLIEKDLVGDNYNEMQWLVLQLSQGTLTWEESARLQELARLHPEGFTLILNRIILTQILQMQTEREQGQVEPV